MNFNSLKYFEVVVVDFANIAEFTQTEVTTTNNSNKDTQEGTHKGEEDLNNSLIARISKIKWLNGKTVYFFNT